MTHHVRVPVQTRNLLAIFGAVGIKLQPHATRIKLELPGHRLNHLFAAAPLQGGDT
jgi:hypothetical protein